SFFKTYESHVYSLEPFGIVKNFATEDECSALRRQHCSLWNRLLRRFSDKGRTVIEETSLPFDPQWMCIVPPAYLMGNWQCEKYFAGITGILRDETRVVPDPASPNRVISEQIRASEAVRLHIRRGTLVTVDAV